MLRYKKIKIFLASMILIALSSGAFAAENDDVYVRKDLFEAYMKNLDSKLDTILKEQSLMREDIKNLTQSVIALSERVTKVETRIDGLEKRFDDWRYDIYLGIGLLSFIGILFGLPVIQKLWEKRKEVKQQSFTMEDIEKLITSKIEAAMKGNLSNAAL